MDDTARLIRAPEVRFEAEEIGLAAFGHNIENRFLLAELAGEQPADNPLLRLHLVTRDSTAPPSRL